METNDCLENINSSENDLDLRQNGLDPNLSVGSVESDVIEDNEVTDELNTSTNSNDNKIKTKKKRKLTPEERKKFLEKRNKQKLEKETQKEKRNQELRQKKELIERQKLEKMAEKEKRDKERQEKETERQRIKDEKQKEKEEKQKERDSEKQKKLEESLVKKRKLEEENARKEEEKRKKCEKEEKQKNILKNFFIKKSSEDTINRKNAVNTEMFANGLFLPFQLGENQRLAQIVPEMAKNRFNRQELDRLFLIQGSKYLYLDSLKSIDYKPLRCYNRDKSEPEIIIESQSENEDNQPKRMRVKHLQFHENVRPPYRGTFRKTSNTVKATRPFIKDSNILDYEVDSDEEWDEGGPGESLDGSDSDGSVKDDYEIDNEFFVPHGYLSEDENDENEDRINNIIDNSVTIDDEMDDQKSLKCGPLLKEQVLMAERNRSFSSNLKPEITGCFWESNLNNCNKKLEQLHSYRRVSIITK